MTMKTTLKNQRSIKILPPEQAHLAPGGRIDSERMNGLPKNCIIMPMVVLDKPEPIKRRRKRKKTER